MSSVENILSLVVTHFSSCDGVSLQEFCGRLTVRGACREDRKLAQRIIDLLKPVSDPDKNDSWPEDSDQCDNEEIVGNQLDSSDEEYELASDKDKLGTPAAANFMVSFSKNVNVPVDKVREAITFYRSCEKGNRSLKCMMSHYRFIRNKHDLQILRLQERNGFSKINRSPLLKKLHEDLKENVHSAMRSGIILHDSDIQNMARKIADKLHVADFKASLSWIKQFREAERIVSRRITNVTSKRKQREEAETREKADEFVVKIRNIFPFIS